MATSLRAPLRVMLIRSRDAKLPPLTIMTLPGAAVPGMTLNRATIGVGVRVAVGRGVAVRVADGSGVAVYVAVAVALAVGELVAVALAVGELVAVALAVGELVLVAVAVIVDVAIGAVAAAPVAVIAGVVTAAVACGATAAGDAPCRAAGMATAPVESKLPASRIARGVPNLCFALISSLLCHVFAPGASIMALANHRPCSHAARTRPNNEQTRNTKAAGPRASMTHTLICPV